MFSQFQSFVENRAPSIQYHCGHELQNVTQGQIDKMMAVKCKVCDKKLYTADIALSRKKQMADASRNKCFKCDRGQTAEITCPDCGFFLCKSCCYNIPTQYKCRKCSYIHTREKKDTIDSGYGQNDYNRSGTQKLGRMDPWNKVGEPNNYKDPPKPVSQGYSTYMVEQEKLSGQVPGNPYCDMQNRTANDAYSRNGYPGVNPLNNPRTDEANPWGSHPGIIATKMIQPTKCSTCEQLIKCIRCRFWFLAIGSPQLLKARFVRCVWIREPNLAQCAMI